MLKNTRTLTAKSSAVDADKKKPMCAAERRFRSAVYKVRGIGRSKIAKETQVELAHLVNNVETYGFGFFPNHYVFEDIIKIEQIVTALEKE
jgi:hypothetical protein